MKPTAQTITGRQGNCFHACVASILEVPIESLPSHIPSKGWFQRLNRWLHRRGLGIVMIPANVSYAKGKSRTFTWDQCGYWIACGKTKKNRRVAGHAVVFKKGRFVFDPYPNVGKRGGLTEIDNYAFFTCVRAERIVNG